MCFDGRSRQELSRGDSIRVKMSDTPMPTINKVREGGREGGFRVTLQGRYEYGRPGAIIAVYTAACVYCFATLTDSYAEP